MTKNHHLTPEQPDKPLAYARGYSTGRSGGPRTWCYSEKEDLQSEWIRGYGDGVKDRRERL